MFSSFIFFFRMLLSFLGNDYFKTACEEAREEDDQLTSHLLPPYHLRMSDTSQYYSLQMQILSNSFPREMKTLPPKSHFSIPIIWFYNDIETTRDGCSMDIATIAMELKSPLSPKEAVSMVPFCRQNVLRSIHVDIVSSRSNHLFCSFSSTAIPLVIPEYSSIPPLSNIEIPDITSFDVSFAHLSSSSSSLFSSSSSENVDNLFFAPIPSSQLGWMSNREVDYYYPVTAFISISSFFQKMMSMKQNGQWKTMFVRWSGMEEIQLKSIPPLALGLGIGNENDENSAILNIQIPRQNPIHSSTSSFVFFHSLPLSSTSSSNNSIQSLLFLQSPCILFPSPSLHSLLQSYIPPPTTIPTSPTHSTLSPFHVRFTQHRLGKNAWKDMDIVQYGTSLSIRYYLPSSIAPWPMVHPINHHESHPLNHHNGYYDQQERWMGYEEGEQKSGMNPMDEQVSSSFQSKVKSQSSILTPIVFVMLDGIHPVSLLPKTVKLPVLFGNQNPRLKSLREDAITQYQFSPLSGGRSKQPSHSIFSFQNTKVHEKEEEIARLPKSPVISGEPQVEKEVKTDMEEICLSLTSSDISASSPSSLPSPSIQPLFAKLELLALPHLHYLQEVSLLPSTSPFQSLSSETLAYFPPFLLFVLLVMCRTLVEEIQSRLITIASTASITQTTSFLTPHRGALQASVTLHVVVTLREELMAMNFKSMQEYLHRVIEHEDYRRIIPETVFIDLCEVERMVSSMVNDNDSENETIVQEEEKEKNEKEDDEDDDDEIAGNECYDIRYNEDEGLSLSSPSSLSSKMREYIQPIEPMYSINSLMRNEHRNAQVYDRRDDDGDEETTRNDNLLSLSSSSSSSSPVLIILAEESLLQSTPSLIRYCLLST